MYVRASIYNNLVKIFRVSSCIMHNNPFGQLFGQGQTNPPLAHYNQANIQPQPYNNTGYQNQGYNYQPPSKPSSFTTIPTLTTGPK